MDSSSFRTIMGNFATGVTVVTTQVNGRLHGFTANAVTSVSLDPMLLLVCVDKNANAHAELADATHFGLSILAEGQREISDLFADRGEPEEGRLRGGTAHSVSERGTPLLDGALGVLDCEIADRLEAGDHTIVLGRVIEGSVGFDQPPLLFFRGAYGGERG
jgi:flavin reductase (DIM6/NTAB) family NADH-FMN oxidoreductase RutF